MAVIVLTGQAASQPGTIASATQTTQSLAITPAQTGSRVYGSLLGVTGSYTVNGATTNKQDAHGIGGLEMCSFRATATSASGTPETLGYTTTGANGISICLCEIEQAGTLTEDASTPAGVSAVALTVTTASFTPPSASLLVAMVQSNGGGSVTTIAMSDTSGLSLTWVQQVKQNGAGNGYSGIWTAALPGGTAHTATASLTVTPSFSAARTRGHSRTGSLAVTPSFRAAWQGGNGSGKVRARPSVPSLITTL